MRGYSGGAIPGKILINRREDNLGYTQAICLSLEDEFSTDVRGHIKPGDDFVEVLNSQVAACVCAAVPPNIELATRKHRGITLEAATK